MAELPEKGIWFWMRNTSYYADLYLRWFIEREKGKIYSFDALAEKRFYALGLRRNRRLLANGKWPKGFSVSPKGFALIVQGELERGEAIDQVQRHPSKLRDFLLTYQQYLINLLLGDSLSDQKIHQLFYYLIETVSQEQSGGGRRGVVKTRPVVYERVHSAFAAQSEQVPNFSAGDISSPAYQRYRVGGILEIYNRATYAIDDVMDQSDFRGGLPTLHQVFSERQAIIAGQYLHLLSVRLLLDELEMANAAPAVRFATLRSLSILHKAIYEREIENYRLQERIRKSYQYRLRRFHSPLRELTKYYLDRVDLRTGKFYEHIVRIAVLFATGDRKLADRFKRYGQALGIRYLIDNDLKDLIDPYFVKHGTPSKGLKGKEHVSFCGDLEIGKVTYPVFSGLNRRFDERIIRLIGRKLTYREKNAVTRFVVESGGVDQTMDLLKRVMDQAKVTLEKCHIVDRSLRELVDLYQYSNLPFERFKEYYH